MIEKVLYAYILVTGILLVVMTKIIIDLVIKTDMHSIQIETLFKIASAQTDTEKVLALNELNKKLEELKVKVGIKK